MKSSFNPARALLLGTALALLPAGAGAQQANTADNTVMTDPALATDPALTTDPALANGTDDGMYTNSYSADHEDDDDDFPWGLLGLLGLGGLMGLKRRDDAQDVHVDARRDTRP